MALRFLGQLTAFGRGILLIGGDESFAMQLARRLAETFELSAVALCESGTGQIYRAGPLEFDGMDANSGRLRYTILESAVRD